MPTHPLTHIWLRAETKPGEKRTALPPQQAHHLIQAGFGLTVEMSSQSIFPWQEYQSVGCPIAEEHSWIESAPEEAIILGLKELAPASFPLRHRHIHFAHVYKNQTGWESVLSRFQRGGGVLYDLEFLVDDQGRRVAAFGYWAGFAGAGLALLAWCHQALGRSPVLGPVSHRPDQRILEGEVQSAIQAVGRPPKVMVVGALGRCGRGAIDLLKAAGATVVAWDLEETKTGGPFPEILECDVFLNCVFINRSIPPFLTTDLVTSAVDRRLRVICDVSCDPYSDFNPLPIYDRCTTFAQPLTTIADEPNPLYLIAIDHLPSLLPKESSQDFCQQLMPYLLQLDQMDQGVWQRASELFLSKTNLIQAGVSNE